MNEPELWSTTLLFREQGMATERSTRTNTVLEALLGAQQLVHAPDLTPLLACLRVRPSASVLAPVRAQELNHRVLLVNCVAGSR